MADYDWKQDCGCPLMGPHAKFCKRNPHYKANLQDAAIKENIEREIATWRAQGFIYLGMAEGTRNQMLWGCRRGCGCVIWDIPTHIKNVCREFHPVAGV
jgi:hypothetical protein